MIRYFLVTLDWFNLKKKIKLWFIIEEVPKKCEPHSAKERVCYISTKYQKRSFYGIQL